jgi:hypothetical protein
VDRCESDRGRYKIRESAENKPAIPKGDANALGPKVRLEFTRADKRNTYCSLLTHTCRRGSGWPFIAREKVDYKYLIRSTRPERRGKSAKINENEE